MIYIISHEVNQMDKKAQELPISVIIVAAIALVALIVIVAIFITRMGTTQQAINTCESYNGKCLPEDPGCEAPYSVQTTTYKCLDAVTGKEIEGKVCCLKI